MAQLSINENNSWTTKLKRHGKRFLGKILWGFHRNINANGGPRDISPEDLAEFKRSMLDQTYSKAIKIYYRSRDISISTHFKLMLWLNMGLTTNQLQYLAELANAELLSLVENPKTQDFVKSNIEVINVDSAFNEMVFQVWSNWGCYLLRICGYYGLLQAGAYFHCEVVNGKGCNLLS